MLSKRVSDVSESATVSMANMASAMKKEGKEVINFGIGEPDFLTPEPIIEYAFKEALKGYTHYTPSKGFPELREKILKKVLPGDARSLSKENVIVTPTKFAINLSYLAIADSGDEIIIPEPYFLSYPEIGNLYGIKPVGVKSNDDFSLNMENIENAITPKTKGVIISNPSNPTGKVFSREQIKQLQKLCIDEDIYLIVDQIYEKLVYEGSIQSPFELDPQMDHTILMSGFSKSYAMTGWRIGYMISNSALIQAADKFQQQTITCAPSISQMAALEALNDDESPERMREVFKKRLELITSLIENIPGLTLNRPEGAFYVFPKYDINLSSVEFCQEALKRKGLILTPGSVFGSQGENHFRISYATDEITIRKGMEKLKEFMMEMSRI
ncbi:pyridoxal phosphate-dependent aminotransferase [Cuniculiplasma sp. SKW3]|uniref:pyridoxal phosphate-dependent aminotransferase n=1 Tax=unclassified Cuniculiplasma TaxID=2619706 RepID=UPI003FD55BF4